MIEVVHIVARVTTDMTRFNAGMASMEARAQTAAAKLSFAGMRMTKYLTLPIAGIAYAGIKTATSFQKSMTLISTQAGLPQRQLKGLTDAINNMAGRSVMQGPRDLADAFYHLQSVFGKTKSMAEKLKMLKNVGQLAQIGGASIEDTASAVAGIIRTNVRGTRDIKQTVQTIHGIIGSGNMSMQQFVDSTGTAVLQVGKLAGMTLKQIGAAEAVFTDENQNATSAMTRMRTAIMMLAHPSDKAAGDLKMFGLTAQGIGEKMRGPGGFGSALAEIHQKYVDFVQTLENKGMSAAAAKTKAFGLLTGGFGGSRTAGQLVTLVQQYKIFQQKMIQQGKIGKTFDKSLADSNQTLSVKFEKAWARMQVALQKFGVAVAPIVLGFLNALVKIANAFSNLPTPIQHFIAAAGVALAVLGPMLILVGSMIQSFKLIGGLLGEGGIVSAGFGGLPLLIIAAVGALVYFAYKSKTFRAWLESWGKKLQGFFKWLGEDVIGPFFNKVYKWFTEGGKASRWQTDVIPALKAVGNTFETLAHWAEWALKKIKDLTEYLIGSLNKWEHWGTVTGGFLASLFHAGDKTLSPKQAFLTKLDSEHGTPQYRKDLATARRKGYLTPHFHRKKKRAGGGRVASGMGYLVGENGPEMFYPDESGNIGKKPRGGGNGAAPLVHIAEMHVRNESDAEIVSGMIARKVCIP